jgi:serine/threonine protein kinase
MMLRDRYRLEERIGQGGMGAVYRAVDLATDRTVAVKQLMHDGALQRAAFQREASLLSTLRHPSVPVGGDYFVEDATHLLVMTFVPGNDLAHQLARRTDPFPVSTVLKWADSLLDLLAYLHGQQPPIVHHDIKPRNLKLDPDGRIVLLDFGLARDLETARDQPRVGYTLAYAPPEQIKGEPTGPRSDLYALAATLHELLARRVPPDAMLRANAIADGQPDPLPSLSDLNPAVRARVSAVIAQGMALLPIQRPSSAAEMRAALRHTTPR